LVPLRSRGGKSARRQSHDAQPNCHRNPSAGCFATLVKAIKATEREHQDITDQIKYAEGLQKAASAWDVSAYREKVEALLMDW
jgi:hypothetical protein